MPQQYLAGVEASAPQEAIERLQRLSRERYESAEELEGQGV